MSPGKTIAQVALAAVASAAWLLAPGAVPAQSRDTVAAKARPRPAVAPSTGVPACCRVVRLEAASPIVTARETATGYTFRFELGNRRRRAALKVGDPVWADFGTNTVKLRSSEQKPCCAIITSPPSTVRDSSGAPGTSPPEAHP
jgi:hypothetical protein